MLYDAITRIQMLIDHNKLGAAKEKVIEAMSLYPETGILYCLDAQISAKKDDIKAALKSIDIAIGYDPENATFYFYKSSFHLRNKESKKALECIDEALNMDSYEAQFFGQKALVLFNSEKREEAIVFAKKGLEIDPGNMLCSNVLSMALSSTGKADQAHDVLEDILEEDPEDVLSQTNMGYNYLRQGNIAKAKEHFGIALTNNPDFDYARAGMIQAIKATNFLYRKVLQYSIWMEKIGRKNQWFFIIGLLVLVQVFPVIAPLYLIFVFGIWFAGPISDVALHFDKYGRYLMTDNERKIAVANIGLIALAAMALAAGLIYSGTYLALAFGLFMAIVPIYKLDEKETKIGQLAMCLFAATLVLLGLASVILPLIGLAGAIDVWFALIITTVAISWVANLVK